jgi:hypothetical protein
VVSHCAWGSNSSFGIERSIIDIVTRINAWLLKRLKKDAVLMQHIELLENESGLSVTDTAGMQQYQWHDITHISAIRRDIYAGDTMLLVLAFHNEQRIIIAENDPLWETLHKKIEGALPNAMPRNQWFVQLLAAPINTPILVFTR